MLRIFFFLFTAVSLFAQTGREIAEKANATQRGFVDETVEITMWLINAKKDTVVRHTKNLTFERANAEDYSMIQFLNPPDVRGTGLLTYQNPKGDDQQWLYLPELRRVKVIASKNKSGAFMGSEFAYEDITGNTLDKFDYKLLGIEKYNGKDCYVLDRVPTYENSGYLKIKSWYEKDTYLIVRSEFTDRKNSLLKVLVFEQWEKFQTGTWRAGRMVMENLQNGKKSVLNFKNRQHKSGLRESEFSQRSLERGIK